MQKYKCFKVVQAAKIVEVHEEYLVTVDEEDGRVDRNVGSAWISKHRPQNGGYFVQYGDGHQSYSPQLAFESGYAQLRHYHRNGIPGLELGGLDGVLGVIAECISSLHSDVVTRSRSLVITKLEEALMWGRTESANPATVEGVMQANRDSHAELEKLRNENSALKAQSAIRLPETEVVELLRRELSTQQRVLNAYIGYSVELRTLAGTMASEPGGVVVDFERLDASLKKALSAADGLERIDSVEPIETSTKLGSKLGKAVKSEPTALDAGAWAEASKNEK